MMMINNENSILVIIPVASFSVVEMLSTTSDCSVPSNTPTCNSKILALSLTVKGGLMKPTVISENRLLVN